MRATGGPHFSWGAAAPLPSVEPPLPGFAKGGHGERGAQAYNGDLALSIFIQKRGQKIKI